MREIIFRGKDEKTDEWVYGFCTPVSAGHGMKYAIITGTERNCFIPVFVKRETIGQFTRITDKNGKAVFEGDIIQYYGICKPIIGIVKICEEDFTRLYGVCIKFCDGSGTSLLRSKMDFIVIGNIHDNPELLTQGERHGAE